MSQTQNLTESQNRALSTIREFIDRNEDTGNSITWYLHCFCRKQMGDKYGYNYDEILYTHSLIKLLMQFFLVPEN